MPSLSETLPRTARLLYERLRQRQRSQDVTLRIQAPLQLCQ
ncbi:hypothetical protein [Nostoc sp.]